MGLEAATYIPQLVPSNPVGATDPKSQGDDHIRLVKQVLQAQFPNIGAAAVTATAAQLNTAAALGETITGFAAPTKKIGTAANADGVATTALRSDATIQLDVTLPYTWSGAHVFSGAVNTVLTANAASIGLQSGRPTATFVYSGASANNKQWRISGGINLDDALSVQVVSDAGTPSEFLRIRRADMVFGNASDNPIFNFLGSGTVTITGAVVPRQLLTNGAEDAAYFRGSAPYVNFTNAAGSIRYAYIQGSTGNLLIRSDQSGGTLDLQTNGGKINADGIEVGYRGIPLSGVKTAAYTLVNSDKGKMILCGGGGTSIVVNSGVFAQDDTITIINVSGGNLTISGSATINWLNGGGSVSSGSRTLAYGGVATIYMQTASGGFVWGAGLA